MMFGRFIQQLLVPVKASISLASKKVPAQCSRQYSSLIQNIRFLDNISHYQKSSPLICKALDTKSLNRPILSTCSLLQNSVRTRTQFGYRTGKPKTVKAVIERFKRLDWGIWIRTRSGRAKSLWKKTESRKYRLRQHVFCNKQQCKVLDKMVNPYFTKKKFYVDDPYERYHKRTNMSMFPEKPPFLP